MSRRTFLAWLAVLAGVVVAQSVTHLVLAMAADRPRTVMDVEHSNGIPDLVSSGVLALAALGAVAIARAEEGERRVVAVLGASVLAALTLADLLHDGAHPAASSGKLVVGLVASAAVLVGLVALRAGRRTKVTLVVAAALLAGSFLASGIDRFEAFAGRRGDLTKEGRLVTKEGLELLGWSLVAIGLWDEALRRRGRQPQTATARASRGRARPRRRAA